MKTTKKLSFAALCGSLLVASQVGAVERWLQPGSGHKFITSANVKWTDTFANDDWLQFTDGRTISVDIPFFGASPVPRTWVVPIPLDATNITWNSTAWGSASGGGWSTRICTFTQTGVFSNCGASVGMGVTSNALVPSGGTAFNQTFLTSRNDATANPQGSPFLTTIKAWH